jgi:hypothetical protein
MNGPLIRDIPSIKSNLELMKGVKAWSGLMPFLKPLLKILKVDVNQIQRSLSEALELNSEIQELASLPDRFNDLFSGRGWIIYDHLDLEVVKNAVALADCGEREKAEEALQEHYDSESLHTYLLIMSAVEAFRPRVALAEKAIIDYEEGRYHACVPVVLSLLDGLVNDLHEKQIGFFAQNASLEAWDSIAGHSKGLEKLAALLRSPRPRTTTIQIDIPYRHGILHGRDLGYDNKLVAAKAWAALFAVRDWAIKAEREMLAPPPPQPEKTWGNLFRQLIENSNDKKLLDSWSPRDIHPDIDFPASGAPENYELDTPERALVEFLSHWRAKNYGRMATFILTQLKESPGKDAGRVRQRYKLRGKINLVF